MTKKRGYYQIAILMHLVFLILGGCEKKTPIKIGFVGGLTGGLAHLGIAGRNGVLLAMEERNESDGINGRQVKLISKDDKQDVAQALKADKELIDKGVEAIIGHMTSTMSIKAVPVINQAEVVMISPTTSTEKLSGLNDYFFRLVVPHKYTSLRLAQFAVNQKSLKTFAIVYDTSNITFSKSVHDDFKAEFEKNGGKIVTAIGFKASSEVNYISLVETLLHINPDGLLIIAGALDSAMICQHVRMKGSKAQIIIDGWAGTNELIEHGGPAVNGVISANLYDKNSQKKEYLDFKNNFIKRFGNEPNFAAVYAYEAAQVLFAALMKNQDSSKLKNTILQQSEFNGLQGKFVFNKFGDPIREVFIISIRNGKAETL